MQAKRLFRLVFAGAVIGALLVPAAGSAGADPATKRGGPAGCDPLDESHCLLPFPNDWYTVRDKTTDTGRRVNISADMMPKNTQGVPIDPAEFNRNDGFSPGSPIMVNVPGIDLERTGAAPITDMARSVRKNAPIALINTRTGKRHPYFAELDANATDPTRQVLIIRPAKRLAEGTRYVVALRNLRDGSGAPIPPGPAFQAMLAERPPGDEQLRRRWWSLRATFKQLRKSKIDTAGLYLAWDFTTTSTRNLTERVLHMRDESFGKLGKAAPKATIMEVRNTTPEQDPYIARRVRGVIDVPSYLDKPDGAPGSRLTYGPDGLPEPQTPGKVHQAVFQCNIPHASFTEAGRPMLFGHGLLGNETAVDNGALTSAAAEHNAVMCATSFLGLSSDDVLFLLHMTQDLSLFPAVPDRMQQAYLNFLFLGRTMINKKGFKAHPAFQDDAGRPVISKKQLTYAGYSLGGIQGAAVTALAQDWKRALLGVPAANFSTLVHRSKLFAPFHQGIDNSYPDRMEQQLIFSMAQSLWDRGEANGYLGHLVSDPLPGTPKHQVLLHEAFGDHQVANVATEYEARSLGIPVHQPALAPGRSLDVTPFWGIRTLPRSPYHGSALIMWDSGTPAPPLGNVPPTAGHDPHNDTAVTPAARQQAFTFLSTGKVVDVCDGKPCVATPLPLSPAAAAKARTGAGAGAAGAVTAAPFDGAFRR